MAVIINKKGNPIIYRDFFSRKTYLFHKHHMVIFVYKNSGSSSAVINQRLEI